MSHLKKENVNKCVSLLREFIDESIVEDNKKGIAILALKQLQRITAGADNAAPQCYSRPRADI